MNKSPGVNKGKLLHKACASHTQSVVGDRSQPGENEGLIFSGIVAQAHPHFERTLFGPMESLHQ